MNIPKIIFIVPYRNRENEKIHFSNYMKYILEDYDKNDYEIYYSFQNDNRPFNRGATKNIGFIALKNKYINNYKNITFVFNDLDTIPYKKNLIDYDTEINIVKHFYGFTYALGGIVSIKGEDFEKCNGFPNNWGWGLEDNELNDRVIKNNIKIDRSNFFEINSPKIIHIKDSPNRLVTAQEVKNYNRKNLLDNLNTITNINYNIENFNNNNNNKFNTDEFIININYFKTLYDSQSKLYYEKDVSKSAKLYSNPRFDSKIKLNFK